MKFYHCFERDGFHAEVEVQIEGYSDDGGGVVIEAWSAGGMSISDGIETFTVEVPGKFSRPLSYSDLKHFKCLEAA